MMVLALDSASWACSAALLRDGTLLAERFRPMTRGHVEALMPMVMEILHEAGSDFADLDLVATTVGPGSFTGIRAGLAAARGIALGRGLPVDGVTTLEAVAAAARPEAGGRPILVALETRRADLYVQRFAPDGTADGHPAALLPEAAARLARGAVLAGDGAERVAAGIEDGPPTVASPPGLPQARDVAAIALARRQSGLPPLPAVAFYLHPPEAQVSHSVSAP